MGTNIDELIENINNTQLDNEENKIVNSIIDNLNDQDKNLNIPTNNPSISMPPHITPEERQMMLKQQQHQQQIMYEQKMQQEKLQQMQQMQHQQMQQQQMQQQQMQQQPQMNNPENKGIQENQEINKIKNNSIYQKLINSKKIIILFLLIFFFNLNVISDCLMFKKVSLFYNIETDKSTIMYTLFISILITLLYYLLSQFI